MDLIFSWLFVTKTIRHEMPFAWFVTFCIITGIAGLFVIFELVSILREAVKKYREQYQSPSYPAVNDDEECLIESDGTAHEKVHVHWPSIIGSLFQDFVLVVALYFVKDETKCEINVEAYLEELEASKIRRLFEAIFAGVTMINALMNAVSLILVTFARFKQQQNSILEENDHLKACLELPALLTADLLFLASVFLALAALLTNVTGRPSVLAPQFGFQFQSNWSYDVVYYHWPKEIQLGNVTELDTVSVFNDTTIILSKETVKYAGNIGKHLETSIWKWPNGTFNFTHFAFERDFNCSQIVTPQVLRGLEYKFNVTNIVNCSIKVGGWWSNEGDDLKLRVRYGYEVSNASQACDCGYFRGGGNIKLKLQWTNDTWQNVSSKVCSMRPLNDDACIHCALSKFNQSAQPEIFCTDQKMGICPSDLRNISLEIENVTTLSYHPSDPCICGCVLPSNGTCLVNAASGGTKCKTVRYGPLFLHKKLMCPVQSSCDKEKMQPLDFDGGTESKNQWSLVMKPFVRCGRAKPPEVINDESIHLRCRCHKQRGYIESNV